MKRIFIVAVIVLAATILESCRPPEYFSAGDDVQALFITGNIPIDSVTIRQFFVGHPDLKNYENTAAAVYRRNNHTSIWYDSGGVNEVSGSLYVKVNTLHEEGVSVSFPYQEQLDGLFLEEVESTLTPEETDLLLTTAFLFYTEKVVKGIDKRASDSMGWLLPRKKVSYSALLKSFLAEPSVLEKDEKRLLGQYYKLRRMLQRYREIERDGKWTNITFDPKGKGFTPGDSSKTLQQVRERLFVLGDLKRNNGSKFYDEELSTGISRYLSRNGFSPEITIGPKVLKDMNIPISTRIKSIMVNMERCRWISPEIAGAEEYIVVNIPSYTLNGFRGGKNVFESPVVVGSSMTKTVVFSGLMSYVVFSPYWNIPKSIVSREILPGIAADSNYLEAHDMEMINGRVRQRPGKNNSLGLVKFMFPNSKDIYLHDSPAKDLFQKERRAFSHGCVRVAKPKELAEFILESDTAWTSDKITAAMNAGMESKVNLKKKVLVYIGYFTAWVNERDELCFYEDIYKRDDRLARLIIN